MTDDRPGTLSEAIELFLPLLRRLDPYPREGALMWLDAHLREQRGRKMAAMRGWLIPALRVGLAGHAVRFGGEFDRKLAALRRLPVHLHGDAVEWEAAGRRDNADPDRRASWTYFPAALAWALLPEDPEETDGD